jgi:hypothetical protein
MKFLLEGERGWIGASRFFEALEKLNISRILYSVPIPYVFSASELEYYVDTLENELRGKPINDYNLYIKQICSSLRKWALDGLVVHVIS